MRVVNNPDENEKITSPMVVGIHVGKLVPLGQ